MKKTIKAPAKINLCLRVNGKREDGYHDLTMIMQSISLFDTIEFEIIKENDFDIFKLLPKFPEMPKIEVPIKLPEMPKIDFDFLGQFFNKKFDYNSPNQINLKSNYSYIPTDERNLIYKVVKYIYDRYNIKDKIFINLKKMIPTSGGLGGGSSDAASMLMFLNRYYKLNLCVDELNDIAASFGSDIPFFIYKKLSICEGRGEIVTKLNSFNSYHILIATPNVRVSTKEIFSKIDNFEIPDSRRELEDVAFNNCIDAIDKKNLEKLSKNLFNDLEIVTESMFYDITIFKEKMLKMGALASLMSGSGPTVFGIFNSYWKALNCKNAIKKQHKDAFVFLARPI